MVDLVDFGDVVIGVLEVMRAAVDRLETGEDGSEEEVDVDVKVASGRFASVET